MISELLTEVSSEDGEDSRQSASLEDILADDSDESDSAESFHQLLRAVSVYVLAAYAGSRSRSARPPSRAPPQRGLFDETV